MHDLGHARRQHARFAGDQHIRRCFGNRAHLVALGLRDLGTATQQPRRRIPRFDRPFQTAVFHDKPAGFQRPFDSCDKFLGRTGFFQKAERP